MNVSVDLPYRVLKEAIDKIEEKKGVCKILPSARFHILGKLFGDYKWRFSCLVCSDEMGGENTGVGAEYCTNCSNQTITEESK